VPRALGCAVASAMVPGLGQAFQRRWRTAALFGVATLAVLVAAVWAAGQDKVTLVDWTVDSNHLRTLCIAGLVWALFCYAAAADAALASWPARVRHGAGAAATLLVLCVAISALLPGTALALVTVRQDSLLDTVFAGSGEVQVARPSSLADLGITTTLPPSAVVTVPPTTAAAVTVAPASTTTVAPTTVATTVPTTPPLAPGRWNIVLLGGDAGPHRWGLRTDTMIVVSVDRQTGDLASVSVPRNLMELPMPAGPLRDRFPHGFNDLANALYTYVSIHPELGLDPAQAIKGALAELLGIPIDNYVIVDLIGFMKIIDALGGVTVNLSTNVHLVPNVDGKTKEAPSVGPGPVTMNGAMALSFVRTREQDSDYSRMKRQRCLLAAVASETSPADLAVNYLSLASAVEGAFRSDVPREQLGDLVRVFGLVNVAKARTLVLVPPVIKPSHPDIARIRALVANTLDAAAPPADPAIGAPTC
jgi:LCP family protein required for cell wall assembly